MFLHIILIDYWFRERCLLQDGDGVTSTGVHGRVAELLAVQQFFPLAVVAPTSHSDDSPNFRLNASCGCRFSRRLCSIATVTAFSWSEATMRIPFRSPHRPTLSGLFPLSPSHP
ncbi:calpain-9 isoform 1 [Sesbania bispinosa]|nr:calpain-9 isoform 1 [Sesbania bispinosa]